MGGEGGMKRIIALALVICAVAMTARAQSSSGRSGNFLHDNCGSSLANKRSWCSGYMDGYRDAVSLGRIVAIGRIALHKVICIPPKVTTKQMADVVQRALREAPEKRHAAGDALVALALQDAWPCPK